MHKHIRSHEKRDAKDLAKNVTPRVNSITSYFERATAEELDVGITNTDLDALLLRAAIVCNWPFDQFENTDFRALIHRGFPGHECPHRHTMASRLTEAAEAARMDIKERLTSNDSRISLALDCWTSPNRWEFMGTLILM